jgi:hypothetical protein
MRWYPQEAFSRARRKMMVRKLWRAGLDVPGDMSVVGYDDSQLALVTKNNADQALASTPKPFTSYDDPFKTLSQ